MMDGSHAARCEKITAGCCQLRRRGDRPKPRQNKGLGSRCVSAHPPAASRPAEPQSFIFTCNVLELIAENSCTGCKRRGCYCFVLHSKHILLFQRLLTQRCRRIWDLSRQNKPIPGGFFGSISQVWGGTISTKLHVFVTKLHLQHLPT